ncbi:MAG: TIM-barrel domain-containing protein [Bacillota bacterium]
MNDLSRLKRALSEAPLWEAAFAARALSAAGVSTADFHRRVAAQADSADWMAAAWLWAAGEERENLPPAVQEEVGRAARRLLPELLHLELATTLGWGALYAAFRVWAPLLPELELARRAKEVREFLFARATRGGRLAAQPDGDGLDPSLVLLVPFGLFGVEDLLMVATVRALEGEEVAAGPAAAWLAWYYQLKGTHPRRLAELREGLTGDSLWEAVVRLLLARAGRQGSAIQHIPTGHDHPYHHYTPERIPRDPLAGRPVELRATVSGPAERLWLEWSLNGEEQPPIEAVYHPPHWQSEGYWSATLDPLGPGARVRYRFAAPDGATGWFDFGVRSEHSATRLLGLRLEAGHLQVDLAGEAGDRVLRLLLAEEEGVLRIRIQPGADAPLDSGGPVAPGPARPDWAVGSFRVRLEESPLRLSVTDGDGRSLLTTHPLEPIRWWTDPDGRVTGVECSLTAADGERFYGTGERFDRLDRRGTTVINTVYNQYKSQGDRTYIPVPFLISSRGYGLWAATDQVGEIDVADSLSDRLRLRFGGEALDLCLIPGPAPAEVLARFTRLTGKAELPPAWAFGPWMSSNNWDSQAEVERQAELTRSLDIPATVLVVEQWSDEATFCLFNDAQYQPRPDGEPFAYADFTFPAWGRWPDPKGMVERLHQQGLKFILWTIPVWKAMNGIRHEQRDLDEAFLIERGYVVKNPDGSPYRIPEGWFKGSLLIDFTHEDAVRWWLEKRRYLLDEVGLDGFKTDGGEHVWERELMFADGSRGDVGRNRYVNQYVGATYRFVQERTGGQGVTFSRAGYTGAQAFPLHWAGDEASTWEALRASIIAGLNAGIAGISFWGWDLGGFSGDIPTAELYCRGAAMACFCPVMQYHAESKAQFNQDRTPWNIAERTGRPEVLEAYRFLAHLRMNLLPYLYSEAIRSHRTGLPMMRPLWLVHPDDPAVATISDQYYLGQELLVAPVVEPGTRGRDLYLPAGEWYDLWTDRRVTGPCRIWWEAPWDRIPVFVRAGAVLPLNLAPSGRLGEGMQNGDYQGWQNLHLVLYPAREGIRSAWPLSPEQEVRLRLSPEGEAEVEGLDRPATLQLCLGDGRRVIREYRPGSGPILLDR